MSATIETDFEEIVTFDFELSGESTITVGEGPKHNLFIINLLFNCEAVAVKAIIDTFKQNDCSSPILLNEILKASTQS